MWASGRKFVPSLDVFGWGRGGLRGEGSSVVMVGVELDPWYAPMGLTDVGTM